LAEALRCTVVLKGSGSIVAATGHVPYVNATGNASLASAGTGDVLAGWLGGLWAQSAASREPPSELAVAIRAVAEHGAAAQPQLPGPLRANDLIEVMHHRLRGAAPGRD
jgi:NAD(P)H-hydrate repair Nnr-like enzyme with NAD(P)H-hydrate dehydratase domain